MENRNGLLIEFALEPADGYDVIESHGVSGTGNQLATCAIDDNSPRHSGVHIRNFQVKESVK